MSTTSNEIILAISLLFIGLPTTLFIYLWKLRKPNRFRFLYALGISAFAIVLSGALLVMYYFDSSIEMFIYNIYGMTTMLRTFLLVAMFINCETLKLYASIIPFEIKKWLKYIKFSFLALYVVTLGLALYRLVTGNVAILVWVRLTQPIINPLIYLFLGSSIIFDSIQNFYLAYRIYCYKQEKGIITSAEYSDVISYSMFIAFLDWAVAGIDFARYSIITDRSILVVLSGEALLALIHVLLKCMLFEKLVQFTFTKVRNVCLKPQREVKPPSKHLKETPQDNTAPLPNAEFDKTKSIVNLKIPTIELKEEKSRKSVNRMEYEEKLVPNMGDKTRSMLLPLSPSIDFEEDSPRVIKSIVLEDSAADNKHLEVNVEKNEDNPYRLSAIDRSSKSNQRTSKSRSRPSKSS